MQINGQGIKLARTTRNLSRERLARMVNVSSGTILRIERGENTAAETIAAIAVVLDMPIEDMFTTTGEAA